MNRLLSWHAFLPGMISTDGAFLVRDRLKGFPDLLARAVDVVRVGEPAPTSSDPVCAATVIDESDLPGCHPRRQVRCNPDSRLTVRLMAVRLVVLYTQPDVADRFDEHCLGVHGSVADQMPGPPAGERPIRGRDRWWRADLSSNRGAAFLGIRPV